MAADPRNSIVELFSEYNRPLKDTDVASFVNRLVDDFEVSERSLVTLCASETSTSTINVSDLNEWRNGKSSRPAVAAALLNALNKFYQGEPKEEDSAHDNELDLSLDILSIKENPASYFYKDSDVEDIEKKLREFVAEFEKQLLKKEKMLPAEEGRTRVEGLKYSPPLATVVMNKHEKTIPKCVLVFLGPSPEIINQRPIENWNAFKIDGKWAKSIGLLDTFIKTSIGVGLDNFILLDAFPWLAWQSKPTVEVEQIDVDLAQKWIDFHLELLAPERVFVFGGDAYKIRKVVNGLKYKTVYTIHHHPSSWSRGFSTTPADKKKLIQGLKSVVRQSTPKEASNTNQPTEDAKVPEPLITQFNDQIGSSNTPKPSPGVSITTGAPSTPPESPPRNV